MRYSPLNRPRLLEVASAIREAAEHPSSVEVTTKPAPRFVSLDPAFGLSSTASRLDRLIRTILADPRALDPDRIASIAARSARLQDPVTPANLVAEAVERLANWARLPLAREIHKTATVSRSFPWRIAWPPEGQATLFEGRGDFVYRRPDGEPCLVILSDQAASEPRERLRLLLSARAAKELELGSIRQAWWVRFGMKVELVGFDRFDAPEIDRAVSEVFAIQGHRD
jgi:hypothetical protein